MENYAELMFQGKTKQLQKAGVIYDKNIELYQRLASHLRLEILRLNKELEKQSSC